MPTETAPVPARPAKFSEPIIRDAFKMNKLEQRFMSWIGEDASLDEIVQDWVKVGRWAADEDAYDVTKRFEEMGYDANYELVELVNDFLHALSRALDAANAAWFETHKALYPDYQPGGTVTWNAKFKKGFGNGVVGGVTAAGQVMVAFPSKGQKTDLPIKSYYLVPIEEVLRVA